MVHGTETLKRGDDPAENWKDSKYEEELVGRAEGIQGWIGVSFSGKERNRFFLSRQAKKFLDLSGLSGADNIADGRVLCLWDFDRDGWQDMALASANAPLLSLYRNQIGSSKKAREVGRMVALRFVGGSRTAEPTEGLTARDGYGAKVRLKAGGLTLLREYRCGEGMAAQNSETMFVGIGGNEVVDSIEVTWPSGKKQQFQDVSEGTLLTVYENPQHSPNQQAATRAPYRVPTKLAWDSPAPSSETEDFPTLEGVQPSSAQLQIFTTMATWCEACRLHLPEVQQLRTALSTDSVELYGVPIDDEDSVEKLKTFRDQYQPAYKLLQDLPAEQRARMKSWIAKRINSDALPATAVVDRKGKLRLVTAGFPTVSQINRLLRED